MTAFSLATKRVSPKQWFMLSALIVNGGNYLYNLLLGRLLGPEAFADAALIITLLLVLSFMGMTFQLVVAKFTAQFNQIQIAALSSRMNAYALLIGIILGIVVLYNASYLQDVLNTQSTLMFQIFGIGIPIYFLMSVNRGKLQGAQEFKKLSFSYQSEMWGRLLITFILLLFIPIQHGILVALGIVVSLFLGLFPLKGFKINLFGAKGMKNIPVKQLKQFILITTFYELTQILINNSDILLVKRFFDAQEAGLYASLALIGRMVYFIAWMFVMLLLPTVVKAKKEGKATAPMLFKYIGYITILSLGIVAACAFFPELIVSLLFGDAYMSIADLLWQYALATSLFAIANIFCYYFLSLDVYKPIWFAAFFGISQVVVLYYFHSSLALVVQMQILIMLGLLVTQIIYFTQHYIKKV